MSIMDMDYARAVAWHEYKKDHGNRPSYLMNKWKKPIKDYYGQYNVTVFGTVWSNANKARGVNTKAKGTKGLYLKQYKNSNGYLMVKLYKKGKSKPCYVHKMVAEAFVPNPNGFKFVHHIDGNKENNHSKNLVWVSLQPSA